MPDPSIPSPHAQRWLTGVLLGLPVLAVIAAGPRWSWCLLLITTATVALWEIHGLLFPEPLPLRWQALSFSTALLMPLAAFSGGITGLSFILFCAVFGAFFLMMLCSPRDPDEISRIARLSLAWFYVPYLLSYVLIIGSAPDGRSWIVFVLAVIITGDAGAYHTGVRFGRHKLFEQVSPKKTIEGAVGGLLASIVTGMAAGTILFGDLSPGWILAFGFSIAIAGQIGDLVESMIKRNCGKKDSSGLLPGHGGLLDRLDSLLFSFPLMWFFLQWAVRN